VDQKREDAVELLRTIAALPGGEPPTPPTFHFAHNSSFMTLYGRDRRVRRGQTEVPLEAIANYVAIHDPDFDDLNFAALNRALALELAGLLGVTVSDEDIDSESERFARQRGLSEEAAFSAWLADNDISASYTPRWRRPTSARPGGRPSTKCLPSTMTGRGGSPRLTRAYLLQIREKQKARRMYGVLERQFRNYYEEATRRHGRTGDNLLQILESRLDNVVYRAGFAKSRDMARQLVTHGHFTVNGGKVDIPSYRVAENDIVEVRQKSRDMTPFVVAQAEAGERQVPAWLEVVPDQMRVLVHALPVRAQIDTQVQEQLIVELYSK